MRKRLYLLSFLLIYFISAASAQNANDNCPPLFTHERTINPEISIINIEVIDSNKYDSFPRFIGNIKTISKKIVYPEIAKMAEVEGTVKLLVSIDTLGNIMKMMVNKGYGAGLEEFAMDIIQQEKFYPAMLDNINVPSQIVIDIKFDLNLQKDKPHMEIDEIKYELFGGQIFLKRTIIFKIDGSAFFSEDRGYEPPDKYVSKINTYLYTKLNDFIIAQYFLDYENEYITGAISHAGKTIITIRSGDMEKSVTSKGQLEPVGLWAIRTVILQAKEQIKWEEVKE